MRILILSQYFWPENFRINDLAVELADRGHEVTVLTGIPNYPHGRVDADFRANPQAFSRYGRVRIVRVPMLARGTGYVRLALNYLSYALSASTFGAWRLRGQSFDYILTFQPSPGTVGLPGVVLRRLKRSRMLLWVQDLWPESLSAIGAVRSPLLLVLVGSFMSWVYRHSDHLLAQSRAFIPKLRERAPQGVPVSYLPNWADINTLHDNDRETRRDLEAGRDQSTFNIYYLGNLGHAQGFPTVLDAIEQLASENVCWHFVGQGSAASWLKDQVARRRLQTVVKFHGMFSAQEMPRFYVQADALLVCLRPDPLFTLTVPSKVQSYLAAGVPVLAMLDGEGARVVEEAGAGLTCAAGDACSLVQNVRRLREMPREARNEMGRAAVEYYEQQFLFARVIDRFEEWLRPDVEPSNNARDTFVETAECREGARGIPHG